MRQPGRTHCDCERPQPPKEHYGGERGYSPPELVTYLSNLEDVNLEPLQEKASP